MKLVYYPDEILLKPTLKVESFGVELKEQVKEMFEIMLLEKGVGLASNQVGLNKSLFVVDVPLGKDKSIKRAFINPEIKLSGRKLKLSEGCLSFKDIMIPTERLNVCEITYQNLFGEKVEEAFTGLPSIVIQHEMEHLQGKTFIDNLPELTREEIRAKLLSI